MIHLLLKNPSRLLPVGVIVGILSLLCPPAAARADYTTRIDSQSNRGTWDGWGTSLAWWANVFGRRTDLANILFTPQTTTLNGQQLPGLNLNIVRYNLGASSNVPANGERMVASPNIPPFKQIQGYWLNWNSTDPASSSWNWNLDGNQRSMLQFAKARGVNHFELFSNSPMWWMLYNHNPSGSPTGATDNLQSWNHQQHAVYMATVAKRAKDNWGITFDSVAPFNEPSANWWVANGTQEGAHFDRSTQATVINHLRNELNARGLTNTVIAASDESYFDQATTTWNSFDSMTRSAVGRVNVHGYQYGGGRRDLLHAAIAGKELWNSEYGESDASGMSLASNLNLDFRWLQMTAWSYWQPFDSGGWGLVQSNPGDNWIGNANPKYFVLAQYTRHIRPGMTILDSGDGNTVTAYDPVANKLVLVVTNYGTPQWITFSLDDFASVADGPAKYWRTITGGNEFYRPYDNLTVSNGQVRLWFPANTVQTIEIPNVYLTAVPEPGVGALLAMGVLLGICVYTKGLVRRMVT
ncbi:MAG: glycoside hydrolase [Pirellulales bacterium]|nr:glycoside hydrolase [Pirellulales bacterium]